MPRDHITLLLNDIGLFSMSNQWPSRARAFSLTLLYIFTLFPVDCSCAVQYVQTCYFPDQSVAAGYTACSTLIHSFLGYIGSHMKANDHCYATPSLQACVHELMLYQLIIFQRPLLKSE